MDSNYRLSVVLAASFFAALAVGPLARSAEPEPAKKWAVALQNKLRQKINVDLDEMAFDDALTFFRQQSDATLIVDAAAAGEDMPDVNLKLKDCAISDALSKLLDPLGLQYSVRDEAIFIYRRNAYSETAIAVVPLNDAQVKELNSALSELSSEEFEVRERASAQLEKLGPGAAPYLAKAVKAATDPETQMRVQKILARYSAKPFPGPAADVAKRLEALDLTVSYELEEMPLREAVAYVAEQVARTSNKPFSVEVDAEIAAKPVAMPQANMQAGNLLRWLSVLSGARLVLEGENLKMVNGQQAIKARPEKEGE